MKTLAFRLALVLALVMGLASLGTSGDALSTTPSIDGVSAALSPCEPYGPGLCKLTSYDCFGGTCCCLYRTDCDPYQGGSVCFPE